LVWASFFAPQGNQSDAQTITHVPLYTFHGDSAGDEFGFSVSGAGDVNGDGLNDLVVGAVGDRAVRVISGSNGSLLHTFQGSPSDKFGLSVSGAGDVNNDGHADIIFSATDTDGSGSARVHSGIDGSVIYTFEDDSPFDRFGESVGSAGDVNGDGYYDLIVGAALDDNNGLDSGNARVLSGLDGSTLYTFDGNSAFDHFGNSVGSAGDVDGDGFADIIVGARLDDNNGSNSGSARVISGMDGSTLYTFNGNSAFDLFGESVNSAGDVNGDGLADLIVGSPGDSDNGFDVGSASVLSGADGSVLHRFNGDNASDNFGNSVSGAGDFNGDGLADLIVGALRDDNNGSNSGSARIFSGIDGSTLYTFNGDTANDQFGTSVSNLGDVNGDGLADFAVGAPNGGANDGGYARVFVSHIIGVPEPSSIVLLGYACLAAGYRRRRTV
jgi:hypothetical protein